MLPKKGVVLPAVARDLEPPLGPQSLPSAHLALRGSGLTGAEFLQGNMRVTKLAEHSDLVPPHHVTLNQLSTSLVPCASPWVTVEHGGRVCGCIGHCHGTPGELHRDIPEAPWKLLIESYSLHPGRLTAERSSAQR